MRSRVPVIFAAGALCAAAALSPREATAKIRNCEQASLSREDGERLYAVARHVLPAHQELRLAERCRWSDSAFAWVTTATVIGENGVAQWWMASCSRDARRWTCEPGALHQEIKTSVDVGGVSRHVRISFDGATSLAAAERLASNALASYVKPTPTLPHCHGIEDQDSRWHAARESHPLPTPNEEIHLTVSSEPEKVSVWFGDFVGSDDVQIGIDFPVPDVQDSTPCWLAREP
ncbi:MAG TPA: hypothetical protein VKG63_09425 [Steroidobacteraceae bacterium]|nr:hypothetical protein [Steroidobacteraceae bacterium]